MVGSAQAELTEVKQELVRAAHGSTDPTPTAQTWTMARLVPLIGVVAVALSVVAFRPNTPIVITAVFVQLVFAALLVKFWVQ
jgi:hypothetical protein